MMDLSAQGHGQTARLRNSHCAATVTTGERATLNCSVHASAKPIMVTAPMNMQIAMNFAAPHAWASMNASGAVSDNRQQPRTFRVALRGAESCAQASWLSGSLDILVPRA